MHRIGTASTLLAVVFFAGCAATPADSIHNALIQAGLKDVSVAADRGKGVITLGGHVSADADKARAAQIAQSLATDQVIANEVAVLPAANAGPTRTVYADLDKGIDNNLDAALISGGFKAGIRHSVKTGVVTLTGNVDSEAQRTQAEAIAKAVPNTVQVVNEIQTSHEKATSN
jgi:osmotically-inducible protein OsmY